MSKYTWISIIGFIVVAGLWIGSYFLIDCYSSNIGEAGSIGDRFGAVNALFTGLAFGGLIITLLMQRDDLKIQMKLLKQQQEEMQTTNTELAGQKAQFELQNKTLAKQQFDNTFFQLLNQVNHVSEKNGHISKELYRILNRELTYSTRTDPNGTVFVNNSPILMHARRTQDEITIENDKHVYNKFSNTNHSLGLYFRILYGLIKYIHTSNLTLQEQYQYASFVRSQLSEDILLLLFYNCVLGCGEVKFKPLVEKYALLKNIPKNMIAQKIHLDWISNDAFDRNGRYEKGTTKQTTP